MNKNQAMQEVKQIVKEQVTDWDIVQVIPVGRNNAVSRKYLVSKTGMCDRAVRQAIADSDAPIINLGYGYFVPDANDETDMTEMRSYYAQEIQRVESLQGKLHTKFGNIVDVH